MARLKYWIWLSCVEGIGSLVRTRLLKALDGPENVFFAGREDYLRVKGVTPAVADRLCDKSMANTVRTLSDCEEKRITVLTLQDAEYPERLRNIPDPPAVLYVEGKVPPVDELCAVAVVGTRKATPYGLKMAAKLGGEIAAGGALVVSGLAAGIDSAAMEGALLAGGQTGGVLGTAVDEVYPKWNKDLFDDVRARGALVSEYPPGMRTVPECFKERNRIISGLCVGTVVVEAPLKSGARNTARHALEQDRDLFAVPGNADASACGGANFLLSEGAAVVTDGWDVLRVYADRFGLKQPDSSPTPIKKEIDKHEDMLYIDLGKRLEVLPEPQRSIALAITRPGMLADEITEAAGLPAPVVLSGLTMLQIAGVVKQENGKRYSLKL